jgi:septal ring factor EnvC (AmiA/AmiB activator)
MTTGGFGPLNRAVLVLALGLSACAADDPNRGGFFGGLSGIFSGHYDRRLEERQAGLDRAAARERDEARIKEALDQDLEDRRATANALDREIAAIEEDVSALRRDIARLDAAKLATEEEVALVEAEVATALDRIDEIETDPEVLEQEARDRAAALRRYIEELQAALDALESSRRRFAEEPPRN